MVLIIQGTCTMHIILGKAIICPSSQVDEMQLLQTHTRAGDGRVAKGEG